MNIGENPTYLQNRHKFVTLRSNSNSNKILSSHLEEIAVLRTVLFLIYVSNLNNHIPDACFTFYVDDPQSQSLNQIHLNYSIIVIEILDKVNTWFYQNNRQINSEKTNKLRLHCKQPLIDLLPLKCGDADMK